MTNYNIDQIVNCITGYLANSEIKPVIISFTIAFGSNKHDQYESCSLLVGIVTDLNVEEWKTEANFTELLWNQAEYDHFEIQSECIDKYFPSTENKEREHYISLLMNDKERISKLIFKNIGVCPWIYIHDLDDHDIPSIINRNFDIEDIQLLIDSGLWDVGSI